MQINSVSNSKFIQKKQNFTGNSANACPFSNFPSYQLTPSETSKAYALPQITQSYREIETFDIPYIGKGKLYELSNGHKIIMIPKASKTYISTSVGVGFSDESADMKDIAHLSEHLLANYWHNANQTSDITKTLKETGANINASTGNSSTTYYMRANVKDNNELENLIKIQLGILTNNNFSEDSMLKEKNIIIEEGKINGYFTKQDRIAYNQTIKNLFNLNSENGAIAEHNIPKIDGIKTENLEKFYNNFYRPDNMTTVIVGNVNDESIKIISNFLNKLSNPKSKIERENISTIKESQYIKQFKRSDIYSQDKNNANLSFINLSFVGPKLNNLKDTENLIVLNKIIKNRLKQQGTTADVELPSISYDKNIPQIISINGDALEEKTENNVKIMYSIIDNLLKNQVSKEELIKAKEQVFDDLSDKLENNDSLALFLNDMLLSDPKFNIKSSFDNLKNISTNDVQAIAKKYLDLNRASLVIVHPNKNETNKATNVSFKGLAELTTEKDIKEYDLPNNLHLIIDSRPGIVKTAVSCQFLYEEKWKKNNGTIEALNSSLVRNKNDEFPSGNWIENNGVFIRKSGSSDNIQEIINTIKKELVTPEFSKDNLEETKKSQNNYLQRFINNTSSYSKQQNLLEYPNRSLLETGVCPIETTIIDLKNYYNDLLRNSQGTILITIPKDNLERIEPEIIKSLSEIPTVRPHDFAKVAAQNKPKNLEKNTIFLKKDDTSDKIGIKKEFKMINSGNIKDEAAIKLLNSILGSKLEKSLRGDLGLTYGAYSNVEKYTPELEVLTISTEIAKTPLQHNIKVTLNQIDKLINELINSKVDEETLNSTKIQLTSDLLIPPETALDRNINLDSSYKTSYDINYSKKLAEAINSLSSTELQKFIQKYLANPYLLEISGNKNAIDSNMSYLETLGKIS